MMGMSYWGYPKYVTVAEKKAKAEKKLEQLRKKRPGIAPVVIEGNTLARTWWGKSWNRNLERYADYGNRIGRGKSYVRHGAVLDLKIEGGRVTALVQGSRAQPYEVVIRIAPVNKVNWDQAREQCRGELSSLPDLLAGKFPKALGEIFLAEDKGLFPTPKEIDFDCSCPDWASMCKHVAATLYGIGARLDEDPLLFFTLRQADTEELVARAVQEKTGDLLARADRKGSRVIDDADLSGLFGIDMDVKPDFGAAAKAQVFKKGSIAVEQVGTKLGLSRHQLKILHRLLEEKTILDIMKLAGRTDRTKFRNQVLRPLLDVGLIEMTIPDKPTSSKQKYRLTEKGRLVARQDS
jgi:uncharacterized Zn finger protein